MKTTSPIVGLFGKSPFRPMQQHMEVVEDCALKAVSLFDIADDAEDVGDRLRLLIAR